jgi:adenylate cyclase
MEELRGSVDVWRHVVMGEAYSPWALVGLADAEAAAGRIDDALGSLDQALAVAAATGSEFYSAEALRRRGELRANAGDAGGIADIENALDMARRQQARAFELRAAMALARIPGHSDPGRAAVLRALEGIPPDPANEDLREARSLVGL